MIIGIGTDLVEIARVEEALKQRSFLMRAFTEKERRQSRGSSSFLAGCFAVKEAVAKCFGTGFSGFSPCDIEVLRDQRGKPYVNLFRGAKRRFRESGGEGLSVSISDTGTLALAFAVLEGGKTPFGEKKNGVQMSSGETGGKDERM